jgi:3-oxoacyl-[acyl-carrier-protein] synthase-3
MLYERLKIDIERDFSTLETFGNTGSVSCPLTTAIAVETGKVLPGDIVALLGIGSGINCTMLGVKW